MKVKKMKESLIELKDVTLRKEGKNLLSRLNWTVNKEETWAILGLNGAGKSTLLRLLMAEYWKTEGEVSVLGTQFGQGGIPELRKRIGVVSSFISERIPESLSPEEIVLTGKYKSSILYAAYGEKELEEARSMLRRIGAASLIGRKYRTLSQGEKQTILIARSLMEEPDLLIFDEASSGLDLFAREAIFQLIQQIKQMEKAPTILFVTHHAEEITKSFSHVLLLKEGQSFAQGPKEEILTQETLSAFYGGQVQLIPIGEDRYYIQPDQ